MTNNLYIPLPHRAVIAISGADSEKFLQGLISNDIHKVSKEKAIYALMLTPQGKFLYDFFISMIDDKFIIDCSAANLAALIKKLSMYKLRSDVIIEDLSAKYEVAALIGDKVFSEVGGNEIGAVKNFCKGVAYIDPRSTRLFARAVIERENEYQSFKSHDFALGNMEDYEAIRIKSAIPDDRDMEQDKAYPLHFGMDDLNAVDYKKGCYVGQEVTARTHYRGNVRKHVYIVESASPLPDFGTEITANGEVVGKLLSSHQNTGLALLKIEDVEKENYVYKVGDTEMKLITNNQ
jgi:folate-binding protein YgfZ